MYKEFYAHSDLMIWPLVGLAIFVLSFIGVLAYVFFGLRKSREMDRMASLPLDDDTGVIPTGDDDRE